MKKVTHVRARKGEYIAVHRRGSRNTSAGGEDSIWLLYLIGIGIGIWVIVSFWKIIVACLLTAAVLALIWIFRAPLGQVICWCAEKLWQLTKWGFRKIADWSCRKWNEYTKKKVPVPDNNITETAAVSDEYSRTSTNYGKIIQYHDWR